MVRQRAPRVPLPLPHRTASALMIGAVVPSILGVIAVAVVVCFALPNTDATGGLGGLKTTGLAAAGYLCIAVPMGILAGRRWTSVPSGEDQDAALQTTMMQIPLRMSLIQQAMWVGGAVLLALVNQDAPWRAVVVGSSMSLGGIATSAASFWLCKRVLRWQVAEVLSVLPPVAARHPRLQLRAVAAWLLGTGVPLLTVIPFAVSAWFIDYTTTRLSIVILALVLTSMISGIAVTAFTAALTADPVDDVTRGMATVALGDYTVRVPVYDTSELGLLQSGFNAMAAGLLEREQLRDLFARHVGGDVARLALANGTAGGPSTRGDGSKCDVAVLYVDIVGSSGLAVTMSPSRFAAVLNAFFATVVDVVERHGGWINKFQGDAALAVFGAPVQLTDGTARALAAARDLAGTLHRTHPGLPAGIGVSAGEVFAGNIGEPRRYEYTVIGDPVNEAARLSDAAKSRGGVAASGTALRRAGELEASHWKVVGTEVLRGRTATTDVVVPC